MDPIEILLRWLRNARKWPLPIEHQIRRRISLWAALRESDERVLRNVAEWKTARQYVIDNLPQKIAEAYGSLLFGEDPTVRAADAADQDRLAEMFEMNALPSELQSAEETCVSEGEVWWRGTIAPGIAHPVVTWHSRYDVIPLLHGRQVVGAAFVSMLNQGEISQTQEVWRLVEIHGPGRMVNTLWRGRLNALGYPVALNRHAETADLPEEWRHGLAVPIVGRIVNRFGRNPRAGVSIYEGVWRQFLVLNEATSIGRENMRLTAKKRITVPQSALRRRADALVAGEDLGDGQIAAVPAAEWDAGEDVLVQDPLDVEEGRDDKQVFKVLEYSFDAEALIAYKRDVVETIAQRCDLVPQYLGSGDFGSAESGTALRVRLLPTVNAAEGRARAWDDELPKIVRALQLLEALPIGLGGIGRDWTNAGATPAIERGPVLPLDENEIARRHADLKVADLLSIETSLRERYPDRDDEWISDEVDRIREDRQTSAPMTFGTPNTGNGDGAPPASGGGNPGTA